MGIFYTSFSLRACARTRFRSCWERWEMVDKMSIALERTFSFGKAGFLIPRASSISGVACDFM